VGTDSGYGEIVFIISFQDLPDIFFWNHSITLVT
jgi:hypothetical protein